MITLNSFSKKIFFGIPVSSFERHELRDYIINAIEECKKCTIYGFSLYSIYSLQKAPEIILLGQNADVIVPDGRPFYWLLKNFKISVKDNISIPETVLLTLEVADEKNYSVMLLGATAKVNKAAERRLKFQYPNINVLHGHHGYFNFENELRCILKYVHSKKPDILLIGISSPQKEQLTFQYISAISAGVIIPCGGMIDVLAGKTKLTPPLLKKLGLASLYRVLQEPRRLFLDRLSFYMFVFFNLLPVIFWHYYILRDRSFSLIEYYQNSEN